MPHRKSTGAPAFRVRRFDATSDVDLARMAALAQDAWRPERRPCARFHAGDLFWRLRDPAYERYLWLWEEARSGDLAGFAEWDPAASALEAQVHPRFADSGDDSLYARMLARAEEQSPDGGVTTVAAESDRDLTALLAARGYVRRDGDWTNCHLRRLDAGGLIEPPTLPRGYALRPLRPGREEVEARVRAHRAGWQSALLTVEQYARLMRTPGYRPELDLVVVAPDGVSFAATANVWWHDHGGIGGGAGLFEPVSTDPAHRRKGLGRALILYGLAQLRALGATEAWVGSVSKNPAATALYESCGMPVVRRDYEYVRPAADVL